MASARCRWMLVAALLACVPAAGMAQGSGAATAQPASHDDDDRDDDDDDHDEKARKPRDDGGRAFEDSFSRDIRERIQARLKALGPPLDQRPPLLVAALGGAAACATLPLAACALGAVPGVNLLPFWLPFVVPFLAGVASSSAAWLVGMLLGPKRVGVVPMWCASGGLNLLFVLPAWFVGCLVAAVAGFAAVLVYGAASSAVVAALLVQSRDPATLAAGIPAVLAAALAGPFVLGAVLLGGFVLGGSLLGWASSSIVGGLLAAMLGRPRFTHEDAFNADLFTPDEADLLDDGDDHEGPGQDRHDQDRDHNRGQDPQPRDPPAPAPPPAPEVVPSSLGNRR
jgi:hypothetical protein